MLSGRAVNERTIASTGQLLSAENGGWAWEIIDAFGLPHITTAQLEQAVNAAATITALKQDWTGSAQLFVDTGLTVGTAYRITAYSSQDVASATLLYAPP